LCMFGKFRVVGNCTFEIYHLLIKYKSEKYLAS
jgi:hypothetical protein